MENIQTISLDIMNNKAYDYIYAKQYDIGREVRFIILDDGTDIDLSGVSAYIQITKPDNTIVYATCQLDEKEFTYTLSEQVTILAATKMPYQIQLVSGNNIISTITSYIHIDKSAVDVNAIESSDEFSALNDLIVKASADYSNIIEQAQSSADSAKTSEINALSYMNNAKTYADNANTSSTEASDSATMASTKANEASVSATNASNSETIATTKANEASNNALLSKSYAVGDTGVRTGEDIDNSKYYYEQAKTISESFSGALRPIGTVMFEDLPNITSVSAGDMYNISNEFSTTDEFKEGSGNVIPIGSNIYKTVDGYWDVLAGSPVTGVKGNAETTYRKGNVNITPTNIGLGNVENKSSDTIRGELTFNNVVDALGFTPTTEIISDAEPTTQLHGDFWLLPY